MFSYIRLKNTPGYQVKNKTTTNLKITLDYQAKNKTLSKNADIMGEM